MKEFKTAIVNELVNLTNDYHAVKIQTAAKNTGINHLKHQEVTEILNAFIKLKPQFKIYQLADNPHDSLFVSAFVSDNETIPVE